MRRNIRSKPGKFSNMFSAPPGSSKLTVGHIRADGREEQTWSTGAHSTRPQVLTPRTTRCPPAAGPCATHLFLRRGPRARAERLNPGGARGCRAVLGGQVYVVGGFDGTRDLDLVDRYGRLTPRLDQLPPPLPSVPAAEALNPPRCSARLCRARRLPGAVRPRAAESRARKRERAAGRAAGWTWSGGSGCGSTR